MVNITVTMEESIAQWARIEAAKRNTSVSRMLGEMLAEQKAAAEKYDWAQTAFLNAPVTSLRKARQSLPTRDSLYER